MQSVRRLTNRTAYLICVVILTISSLALNLIWTSRAKAAQVTSRSIKMSSSANGFVDAQYVVTFTTATTSNVGGAVVEFCANTPIIGDSCTPPTGFDLDDNNLNINTQSGITDFVVDTTNSDANTLILTRTAASVNSGVTVSFTLGNGGANGVTNPTNTNTTFYGRILTYATTVAAQAYTSASPGTHVDDGGAAMSTANQLTITAKVQESLTFCVYTNANCGAGGSSIALGDSNGVLSTSQVYTDSNTKFDIATNALNGVIVRMKGVTLTSGGNTITAIGGTATASSPGSEQFGVCLATSGGSVTSAAPYNNPGGGGDCNGTGDEFAFDGTATNTTYGDDFASSSGASNTTVGTMKFAANIANTTEAGIYTTTLTFIATGTY